MKKSPALLALAFASTVGIAHAEDLLKHDTLHPNQGYYIRGGGDVLRTTGSNATTFGGGTFAGGLNFAESDIGYHQLELQIGILGSRTDYKIGPVVAYRETDTAIPLLLNYNYDFKLTDIVHPYVGGSIGLTHIQGEAEGPAFPAGTAKANGTAFTFGAGAGVYFRCTDHFGIDAGYRFIHMTSYTADVSYGGTSSNMTMNAVNAHSFQVAAVYRF